MSRQSDKQLLFAERYGQPAMRAPIWWLWNRDWRRSWTMGHTAYEITPTFKLHIALYLELGTEAYEALVPRLPL